MLPDFRLQQRELLLEISRAMTARLDLTSLMKLILASAVEILNGQAGLVILRKNDNSLAPYASTGLPLQAVPLFEPLWRDLPAEFEHPLPAIPDLGMRLALASRAAGVRLRQVVSLPLSLGDEAIGFIFIFRTYGTAFSNNDRKVLGAFADQAAIAVQNARLYQQVNTERERLDAIIENSGDGVMIINPHRIIQTWNRALANFTGIGVTDAVGRPCYDVLDLRTPQGTSICHTRCPLIHSPADGRLYVEGNHHRADGLTITLADNYAPRTEEEGKVGQYIANVRDVSRLHEAEELKQTLLSIISHELKTPVSIIKGYAGTLSRDDAHWDEGTLAEGLAVIEEEADKLDKLISNLLDASRLQAGGIELKSGELDLPSLATHAIETMRTTTDLHTFELAFPASFPLISGDVERINQLLTNLISNAIKYSPEGGLIRLGGEVDPDRVRLYVKDEGIGIPVSEQEHIFDRFHRIDNRLTRQAPGTGLGLYLVRAVAEAHGGKVWVQSEPGKGSTFWVELPLN